MENSFCLRMTVEFQPVELGADVKVPPQGNHVLSPPISLLDKESIFGDSMSVKDRGI